MKQSTMPARGLSARDTNERPKPADIWSAIGAAFILAVAFGVVLWL